MDLTFIVKIEPKFEEWFIILGKLCGGAWIAKAFSLLHHGQDFCVSQKKKGGVFVTFVSMRGGGICCSTSKELPPLAKLLGRQSCERERGNYCIQVCLSSNQHRNLIS